MHMNRWGIGRTEERWKIQNLHEILDQRLGQQPGLVQQPALPVDMMRTDQARARDERERLDEVREVAGKGNRQAPAQRVADQVKALPAPRLRRRQHEQHLRRVQTSAVLDIHGRIGVSAAKVVCSTQLIFLRGQQVSLFCQELHDKGGFHTAGTGVKVSLSVCMCWRRRRG